MNSYWDAIARAALDLPADAAPRSPSLFERSDAPSDGRLEIDDARIDATVERRAGQAREHDSRSTERSMPPAPPVSATDAVRSERPEATLVLSGQPREAWRTTEPPSASKPRSDDVEPADLGRPSIAHVIHRTEHLHVERSETVQTTRMEPTPLAQPRPAANADVDADDPIRRPDPEEGIAVDTAATAKPMTVEAVTALQALASPVEPATTGPWPSAVPVQPPPLLVEIDHVEIRLEPDRLPGAAAAPDRRTADAAVPSLNDYLARQSVGRA